ncbi:hypothetical protein I3842_02G163000 [Carya illinoinensis]|uniref:Uncharacterized protein n=1 Tax=Carya illinoinensis TaxID=32201 RepID=A0A922K1C3_CARIL|nr:hypothetical protein I3842_02G163000 [Carya illinoinensis]
MSKVSRRHVIPTKFIELDDHAYGLDVFLNTLFLFLHTTCSNKCLKSLESRHHVIPTKFVELDDYAYGLDVFLNTLFLFLHTTCSNKCLKSLESLDTTLFLPNS